jgi:hypothetical protein
MLPESRKIFKQLALGFAALSLAAVAQAQQSSGNITGSAVAGDTVVVHGPGNGFHRELSVTEDGKFNLRRVPMGEYTVTIKHADGTTAPVKATRASVSTTKLPRGKKIRSASTTRWRWTG